MSYHIVSIEAAAGVLTVKDGHLRWIANGEERHLPLEDVGGVVLNCFSASIQHPVLVALAKHRAPLVLCERYHPVAILLPAERAGDTALLRAYADLTTAHAAALWKATVDAKCHNQAVVACALRPQDARNRKLATIAKARSPHKEGAAARQYWPIWAAACGQLDFVRLPGSDDLSLNSLVDYAYGILLCRTLQLCLAMSLDPAWGIGHAARERSAALAYDLMEPFRPAFDLAVATWCRDHADVRNYTLTPECKRFLASTLQAKLPVAEGGRQPLQTIIERCLRTFRLAVVAQDPTLYQPWNSTSSKWAGCW